MYRQQLEYNVPNIPPAPIIGRKTVNGADREYWERKKKLVHKLPFYNKLELLKKDQPYYRLILYQMVTDGQFAAVKEMYNLMRDEGPALRKANSGRKKTKGPIVPKLSFTEDKVKFKTVADGVLLCHKQINLANFDIPVWKRMEMGEYFLKEGDVWLAQYFFTTALNLLEDMDPSLSRERMEAEMNCLLAFIIRENNSDDLEIALEEAISHLVICRTLSKNHNWQLKPNLISIRLKKPIALHGLRNEYETIEGSSMTLYLMATMLEHEMLIGLANEILHHHQHVHPTPENLLQAHILADNALKLAMEIRHPIALSAAMIRFGVVLIHNREFNDALPYFKNLIHHAEIHADIEAYAIGYHNLAMCRMGQRKPVEAITCLLKQKDVSEMYKMEDLEADALQELGLLLLQEGQIWEAEESYACAYEAFVRAEMDHTLPKNHCNYNFAFWGISAGLKLWPRFAGFVIRDGFEDLNTLVNWKSSRIPMPDLPRPNYDMENGPEKLAELYHPNQLTENATFPSEDFYGRSASMLSIKGFGGRAGKKKSRITFDVEAAAAASPSSGSDESGYAETEDDDFKYTFASDYERQPGDGDSILETRRQSHIRIARSLGSAIETRGSLGFPQGFSSF